MEKHSAPQRTRTQHSPKKPTAATRVLGVVSVLAIAAGTLGVGVYLKRDSQAWQRILGTEPVIEVIPEPGDELGPILDSVTLTNDSLGTSASGKLAQLYSSTQTMLTKHVRLLTPEYFAPVIEEENESGTASAQPVTPLSAASAKELANQLATSGVGLVQASVEAPGQRSRSESSTGFELILQARTLLQAAGGTKAQIDALPTPKLAKISPTDLPDLVLAQCPLEPGTDSPVPETPELGNSTEPTMPDSGIVLGQLADAAYRLGYAYNVAESRTSGSLRNTAGERSDDLVALGTNIETQFSGVGECVPLREPAYTLPQDAAANPMDAARSGEEQLALLLRDAAATQQGEVRAELLQHAWDQALYTRLVTGKIPAFTD
ncbi:hypothetical protein CQ018_10645 [Arthrobacter sp. MYb227]|uniref:hypothetical protein n=1 Tax=Arthrobacter sp. MYb227 TaxID=1848601 RepID=UPI000CFCB7D5|nr:hypothetical protein [Arthrobacter sp. MYb227]PQZ92921.1 hypothetical protein CQ018_10645 [Arthrobacter sp. MYb227]